MADDMCGPSNALKNFQKHSTVDRTLQQDRLVHRQSPSQGFRTSSSANTGLLDSEFQAFQAGHLPFETHGLHPQAAPFAPALQHYQQPGPSGWASDFQRLNISNPTPQLHQPFTSQRQAAGGWSQEFARHQGDLAADRSMQMPGGQAGPAYRSSAMNGMNIGGQYMGGNYMGGGYMGSQHMGGYASAEAQSSSMAQEKQTEVFDEEAFARAFDEAAKQEVEVWQQGLDAEQTISQTLGVQESTSQQQQGQSQEEISANESEDRLTNSEFTLSTQGLIGADQIHRPTDVEPDPEPQRQDSDALARTASQLLDNVQHDQSTKFQNSTFLRLMQQLRDKEVRVEGNNIVGANTS